MWLWIDFFDQNVKNSKKNLIFYSIICWSFLLLIFGATIHSPMYGFTAGLLLIFSVFVNTIYKVSEHLGIYFITLFWFTVFVGVWIIFNKTLI